ncbi:MAG: hypothetical protein KDA61_23290 [Planctomycetales bacterium]|nr:hypothetical protein [Planctomycetales bacterium]
MNARRLALALALCCGTALTASNAQAQCGSSCAWNSFGYGSYVGVGDLYRVLAQNVPHFAAFPPVYYSVPMPRTYGYSPFAYLPHVQTPDAPMAAPEVIENPYFEPASTTEELPESSDRTTAAPVEIVNPYVTSPGFAEPVLQAAR